MSLLMQALRKAERARSQNGHDAGQEPDVAQAPFGQDAVPSPPPIEGGPAFAVMPDSWRLEPLDGEPPVVAAQEAAHDPVPPQARHEPARPSSRMAGPSAADALAGAPREAGDGSARSYGAAHAAGFEASSRRGGSGMGAMRTDGAGDRADSANGARTAMPSGGRMARAIASSQRRLFVLAGVLAALLAVFAFIYWRAVYGPGPGARLPMVPMPAPGSPQASQAGAPQGAGIPVSPYVAPTAAAPATQPTAVPNVDGQGADAGTSATPGDANAPYGASGATAAGGATMPGGAANSGGAPRPGRTAMAGGGAAYGAPGMPGGTVVAAPGGSAAPATQPKADVIVPTPDQLAAITDPAIRAEALRDAEERAARQVRAEAATPPAAAASPAAPAATPARPGNIGAQESQQTSNRIGAEAGTPSAKPQTRASTAANEHTNRPSGIATGGSGKRAAGTLKTAVGKNGDVRFVRGAAASQVMPSVQDGYAALKAGDLAAARQHYDHALLQDPHNRDALLGSAAVALREQDGRQASNNYLRLLELDPNDPEALAGLAQLSPGDLQASEIRLRGLARQHPESGPVQFALGNLYARQGRWPEAQQSYFRAFNAMPENADYAFNLGVGLDRMNQPRLAQTYYRRALELAQASPPGFNVDAVRKRLQVLETPPQ